MRTASYVRVSTEEQLEGHSLAAQERGIEEYCAAKGWQRPQRYVDEGFSARSEAVGKRPALQALLEACQAGHFDVVVVYSLDRWSRNLAVTLLTFGLLARHNVAFASATENIDYSTPEGRLFVAMLGAFAQYFSDSLAKHTRKGIAERAHRGLPVGPVPFGYRRDEKDGRPVVVAEEAEAVTETFRMRAASKTYAEIAAWLNVRGFRTRNTHRLAMAGGETVTGPRPFTVASVRFLLANPFYVGRFNYDGTVWPGHHEPIVGEALWELAQGQRAKRRKGRGRHRPYLLAGLARCAECGWPLWSETSVRGIAYYRQQHGTRQCSQGGRAIPCTAIDSQVEAIVGSLRLEPSWRETVVERVVALSERERIASERRQVEDRLKRLGRAYVDGLISERAYDAERRHLRERLASLVLPEVDVAVEAGSLLEEMQELWREASLEERHRLLSGMVEAVYIDLGLRRVVGITPRGPFQQAFAALSPEQEDGSLLLAPEEIERERIGSQPCTVWWRRGRIELPVQKKAHPDIYRLSRRFVLAGRTSADGVPAGAADSLEQPSSASEPQHLDIAAPIPNPSRRGQGRRGRLN